MNKTIGIVGGGQLGKMISHTAQKMGFRTVIFSNVKSCATDCINYSIIADYQDNQALLEFTNLCDVITFEFENIPYQTVDFLSKYKPTFPNANSLNIAQHRLKEKQFLNQHNIKTVKFAAISNILELEENFKNIASNKKAVLKTTIMGYDGKGQFIINNINQCQEAFDALKYSINSDNPYLILEEFYPFDLEISVIIARSKTEVASYQPTENIHKNGILDKSIYPARVSNFIINEAQEIGKKIATKLDLIGILAVEFFIKKDEIIVNEIAPRPHNSGHFSMDAAATSQFEQLIRAINNLKLGSTKFYHRGFMQNIIGFDINNINDFYQNENAKIHIYGKDKIADGRKMGHINFINQ